MCDLAKTYGFGKVLIGEAFVAVVGVALESLIGDSGIGVRTKWLTGTIGSVCPGLTKSRARDVRSSASERPPNSNRPMMATISG